MQKTCKMVSHKMRIKHLSAMQFIPSRWAKVFFVCFFLNSVIIPTHSYRSPSTVFLLQTSAPPLPVVLVSLSWWQLSLGRWPRHVEPAYWSAGRLLDRLDRSPAERGKPQRSRGGSRWRWSDGSSFSPAPLDSPSLDSFITYVHVRWGLLSIKNYLLPVPFFCHFSIIYQD